MPSDSRLFSIVAIFDISVASSLTTLVPKFLVEVEKPTKVDIAYDAGYLVTLGSVDCVCYDLRRSVPFTGILCEPDSFVIHKGASYSFSLCGRLALVHERWSDSVGFVFDLAERRVLCSFPFVGAISWIDSTQILFESSSCVFHGDLLNRFPPPAGSGAPDRAANRFTQFGLMVAHKPEPDRPNPCLYRANVSSLRTEICSLLRVGSFHELHLVELKITSVLVVMRSRLFVLMSSFSSHRFVILRARIGASAMPNPEMISTRFVACEEYRESSSAEKPPVSGKRFDDSPFARDELSALELPESCSKKEIFVPRSKVLSVFPKLPPALIGLNTVDFQPDFVVFALRDDVLIAPSSDSLLYLHEHLEAAAL